VVVLGLNSELSENGEDKVVLDRFRPLESKTLRPVWSNYAWKGNPLEWSSRPPYMAGGLRFPFEVGGPSSGSVIDLGRSPSVITERIRDPRTYWRRRHRDLGRNLFHKRQVFQSLDEVTPNLPRSLGLRIRSMGPLAGRQGFWQVRST
jgi:hypothetical protein